MKSTVAVRQTIAALAVLTAVGCAAGDGTNPSSTMRDSAGVTIVENARPRWDADQSWRIAAQPVLRIGRLDGPPEYQLFRAWSAARLTDGRIVVANGGTNELRFYGPNGRHLFSVGRTGEGPGEFRDLQRVWVLPGDSLLAYDFGLARLSVFTPGGEFVRMLSVASPDGRQVLMRGPFDDGSLLAMGAPLWGSPGATSGVVRDSVPYYRFNRDGNLIATVGRFPSVETYRMVTDEGWRLTSLPFPRVPVAALAGDHLIFGPADTYELQVYTAAGRLERMVRLPGVRRRVGEEDIARFRTEQLERAEREGTRRRMERMLSEMPYPETMPLYEDLEVDASGNLWVADYRAAPDEESLWRVFSRDGEYLGVVAMPDGFEPFQIGSDFLLGRWVGDLDVEHIHLYRLVKP